ncbi:MAG: VOC family protein [Lachnospiraceae bacterium]|jgi:catechol 2,3-dioxygenase-like lactoylglutathione lyase family enzyme|nr:VOC family protein [Lachnospiraceae bacterium]MDE7058161.1 VOC family protein [Lachnospiraceae bacterium]
MLIQGIHHVCIKCDQSEMEKVKNFYHGVLQLPLIRTWGEGEAAGMMFDTGAGFIEVFANAERPLPQGAIRHFALQTADVDKCVEAVRNAGYPVTMEPNDIIIQSTPPVPARIAFVNGPVGEEIEFFCEGGQ